MYEIQAAEPRMFEFAVDGEHYGVPLLTDMPYPVVKSFMEARKSSDALTISDWYMAYFDEHAKGCLEKLTYSQVVELLEAYDKACNAGE